MNKLEAYERIAEIVAKEMEEVAAKIAAMKGEEPLTLAEGQVFEDDYRELLVVNNLLAKEAMFVHEAISELKRPTRQLINS